MSCLCTSAGLSRAERHDRCIDRERDDDQVPGRKSNKEGVNWVTKRKASGNTPREKETIKMFPLCMRTVVHEVHTYITGRITTECEFLIWKAPKTIGTPFETASSVHRTP